MRELRERFLLVAHPVQVNGLRMGYELARLPEAAIGEVLYEHPVPLGDVGEVGTLPLSLAVLVTVRKSQYGARPLSVDLKPPGRFSFLLARLRWRC